MTGSGAPVASVGETIRLARPASWRLAVAIGLGAASRRGGHRAAGHIGMADLTGIAAAVDRRPRAGDRGGAVLRPVAGPVPLRRATRRPRCRVPCPRRSARSHLRATRTPRPDRARGLSPRRPGQPVWCKTSTRCRTSPCASCPRGSSPPSSASPQSACCGGCFPRRHSRSVRCCSRVPPSCPRSLDGSRSTPRHDERPHEESSTPRSSTSSRALPTSWRSARPRGSCSASPPATPS